MATGQRARGARTRPRAASVDTNVARGRRGRAGFAGALLLGLVILGGVVWLAGQHTASAGAVAGAANGQPAPGRTLTLPATRGGALSLRQFAGRKVVLYFYEGST